MTMSDGLNYAFLALDSYNRGYDPDIELNGSTVDGLTILARAVVGIDDPTYAAWQAANFYAVAYQDSVGNVVISYRGTDDPTPTGDIATGWVLGTGYLTSQAELAAQFHQQVKATYPNANITLTGHSLGGGLAGLCRQADEKHRRIKPALKEKRPSFSSHSSFVF